MSNEPALARKDVTNLSEIKKRVINAIAYDPGLNRAIDFSNQHAEPIKMFNRNFLISEVQDQLKVNPNQQASFLMFDLADTFFANMVDEKNGDLLLNRFARRIIEITQEVDNGPGKNQQVKVCRYGGDEFCIAVIGENIEELVKRLKISLESESKNSSLLGLYKSNLDPESVDNISRPISLKKKNEGGEVIDVITRPTDFHERQAFDYFLNQGLILTENQTKKALETKANFEILTKNTPYIYSYPNDKKLRIIMDLRPDLTSIVIDMMTLPEKEKQEAIFYLENRVFDRLIGGVVQTPAELLNKKEQYKQIVIFDLKFVKEFNEITSYQEGDELIKQLWKLIDARLEPFTSKEGSWKKYKVAVSRRGGTFSIALPSNILITNKQIRKLTENLSLKTKIRGKEIEIPIGIATVDAHNKLMTQKSERRVGITNEDFNVVNNAAEKDFYKKFISLLTKERFKKAFLKEGYQEDNDPLDSLIIEFITGKRSVYRAGMILESIRLIDKQEYLEILFKYIENFSRSNVKRDDQYNQYELYKELKQKIKEF